MIELIETGSERVVGVRIAGKIEREDIDRIIDRVEPLLEKHDLLSVHVEVESLGGISFDALVQDVKFALPNFKRFERKAVVSDKQWIARAVEWGDKLFPSIEVKHFGPDERDAALAWAKERA